MSLNWQKDLNVNTGTVASTEDTNNNIFGRIEAQATSPTIRTAIVGASLGVDVTNANTFTQPTGGNALKAILSRGLGNAETVLYSQVTITNTPNPNDGFLTLVNATTQNHPMGETAEELNRMLSTGSTVIYRVLHDGTNPQPTGKSYSSIKANFSALDRGLELVLRHNNTGNFTNCYLATIAKTATGKRVRFFKYISSVRTQIGGDTSIVTGDGISEITFRVNTDASPILAVDIDSIESATAVDSTGTKITTDGNVGISHDINQLNASNLDRFKYGTWV